MTRAARRQVNRAEVEDLLRRWQAGAVTAPELKTWVAQAVATDVVVREVLAELDVLEVFLIAAEDVPALLAMLDQEDAARALEDWTRYRDAIDLDERSKALKKDPFYRPFCR